MILKHVHRPKPDDDPQNYEYGEYWKRHRDIDNTISSAFMFLPEHFRLPENYGDPTAVHTNLNYHAALICLHLAALEKIEKYQIPVFAKKASETRLFTAAQEIVNIIKMTSHMKTNPRSPMAAISLYCAAMVFIYQCKDEPTPQRIDNLDFIISAMDAIGREHIITRAFLKQLLLDLDRNNITQITRVPKLGSLPEIIAIGNHNIPLLTRSQFASHSQMQPPLPGRLPLGNPRGNLNDHKISDCGIGFGYKIKDGSQVTNVGADEAAANKRKRGSPSDFGGGSESHDQTPLWGYNSDMTPSSASTTSESAQSQAQNCAQPNPFATFEKTPWAGLARSINNTLPVRTGSPATVSGPGSISSVPAMGDFSTGSSALPHANTNAQSADACMYTQFANTPSLTDGNKDDELVNSWSMAGQNGAPDWDAIASSIGLSMTKFPAVLSPPIVRNNNNFGDTGSSTNPD
ncbi:homeodomain superfamily [Pestalotiopsis sp. IQ-011]